MSTYCVYASSPQLHGIAMLVENLKAEKLMTTKSNL